MSSRLDVAWLEHVGESVPRFLKALKVGNDSGRYLPCLTGATSVGREMGLGYSCFALRSLFTLGQWEEIDELERGEWLDYIRGFQQRGGEGAFIDPPEIAYLERHPPLKEWITRVLGRGSKVSSAHSIVLAETKQAIATLADVKAEPIRHFHGFPVTPNALREWLDAQNWRRPWGAGGQAAGIVVFIQTQAPAFLSPAEVGELVRVCSDFYTGLAHRETGGYFRGPMPQHGELINGAMKVLMALDWLDIEPHYSEELIATTISQPPSSTGCHLVDAVYVLHQCARGRVSRKVREYCLNIVEMIRAHHRSDGGFSFNREHSQKNYYGVPITRGYAEGDVQGTCLLVWALAMIWRMLEPESARWKIFRP